MIIVHSDQRGLNLDDPRIIDSSSNLIMKAGPKQLVIDCRNIVTNGMTFKLTRECLSEIAERSPVENLFTPPIAPNSATTGLTLGDHLVSGRHMPPINLALFKVAQIIGKNLSATGIIWRPAGIHMGFDHFSEATYHYENEGIFPLPSQIAILESSQRQIQTRGLDYFCGYDIRINFPIKGERYDWIKHVLKLAQAAIRKEMLTEANPILHKSPEKSELVNAWYVGRYLEIKYSTRNSDHPEAPAKPSDNSDQAAFGAAARTF